MKTSRYHQVAMAAFAVLFVGSSSSAKAADTYATYDVNATYDITGTVEGSFTLDTTTNTSYLVDLTIVGVGGVNSATLTDPTQFGTGTYATAAGPMVTFDDGDPADQVFLTYPAGGGTLYNGGFGSSSVGSYFSPTCGGEICGYPLSGSVTLGAISATPEPASWAMMLVGFGGLGAAMRTRRRTATATA